MWCLRMIIGIVGLTSLGATAGGQVVVELVPDNPGPYTGSESLTVDVWLHSQIDDDALLTVIQLDFTNTPPELSLDDSFTFDFSAIPEGDGFASFPELPVPFAFESRGCWCPSFWLPLPAQGLQHIGSIGAVVPSEPGVYCLDALNADEPDSALCLRGALIHSNVRPPDYLIYKEWRASNGDLTGGILDFVVSPPIPALSDVGLTVMMCLLVILGCWSILRRRVRGYT